MIKTIKFNDNCEIELSNNIGWAMEYREQFGHDIIPDILPVVSAIVSIFAETDKKHFDIRQIDKDVLQDALINLAGLQFVDFINLCWAMAKAADEKTPVPKKWIKQFNDGFFIDRIAPDVFGLLVEGLISTKNLSSLNLAEATTK